MVEQALSLGRDLVADPASVGRIIHGDLHYENVLARRPRAVAGDRPEADVRRPALRAGADAVEPVRRAAPATCATACAAASTPWSTPPGSTRTGPATGSSSGWCSTPTGRSRTPSVPDRAARRRGAGVDHPVRRDHQGGPGLSGPSRSRRVTASVELRERAGDDRPRGDRQAPAVPRAHVPRAGRETRPTRTPSTTRSRAAGRSRAGGRPTTSSRAWPPGCWRSGIEPEDRVAVIASTRYEWVLGVPRDRSGGAAVTAVDPAADDDTIAQVLADSGARVVIAEDYDAVQHAVADPGPDPRRDEGRADRRRLPRRRVLIARGAARPRARPPRRAAAGVVAAAVRRTPAGAGGAAVRPRPATATSAAYASVTRR